MDWISLFLKLAPVIVQAGLQAKPLVEALIDSIRKGSGDGPTQAQLDSLTKLETALRAELHKPVPDEDPPPKPVIVDRIDF